MLVQYLQTLSFTHLVDMGCGTGDLLRELAPLKPQAHFTGIDRDQQILVEARHRLQGTAFASHITWLAEDCTQTSLSAGSADVVLFVRLLHHLEDPAAALEEANRILVRGGYLLIREGQRLPDPLFAEMNEQLRKQGLPPEVHPGFEVEELTKYLDAQGFTVDHVFSEGSATFATPPYTTKVYATNAFLLSAQKS